MTYPRFKDESITKPEKKAPTMCVRCFGVGALHTYGTCFRCNGRKYDPTFRAWGFPKSWTDEQCEAFLNKKEQEAIKRSQRSASKAGN